MGLGVAWKAFLKALRDPKSGKEWLQKTDKKQQDSSHLRLLFLLQKSGRFIDFLKEDLTTLSDAQIGSAVRKIQSECQRSLEEFVSVRPLFAEEEGKEVTIPAGFSAAEVKLVGRVKGSAPYKGILRHRGWKAEKCSLPAHVGEGNESVICPAEVEVK